MTVAQIDPRALRAALKGLPRPPATRERGQWMDRFLGSDPGLNRFRNALHCVLSIAAALEAEWLFVHFTGALQIASSHGTGSAAAMQIAIANHEFLVIAMILGALVAMISTFAVMDTTAKGQLHSMLFLPVPMVPALALGIALGSHRVASLVMIAVVLAIGTYLRRFGPRGFMAGILLFMGDFFGFFLHAAVTINDIGWLAAEIGVGLVVALAIRFTLFFPHPQKALERTQRSYGARARKVANLALELFDDPEHSEREVRRLHRQLVRLNEAALMIDAQLGDPNAVAEGSSGQLLHQRLFDVELAISNIARFAEAMAYLDLPGDQRSEVRLALLDIVRQDAEGARTHATNLLGLLLHADGSAMVDGDENSVIVAHRFAGSVLALATSMSEWMALGRANGGKGDFRPSVMLFGGWLPGSAQVSATASLESGNRRGDRLRLAPYTRTAIQMGIAVGLATFLGIQISSYRFYWAVIAAFITFMGANNSGEQILKACYRVAGTVVGIGIGSLLVDAVGHHAYGSIAVILVALFFGMYFLRINYAFMVVGVTVMVAQLYMQLGEFSNSLLLLRLGETALGAAVAIIVVVTVLPLRTRRVLRVALRAHVQAVGRLAEHASAGLLGTEPDIDRVLRADARAVDVAYQALVATALPLRRNLVGSVDENISQTLRLAAAARHYARNLVTDVGLHAELDELDLDARLDIERASATLRASLETIVAALSEPTGETYIRSSALFEQVERRVEKDAEEHTAVFFPGELALRDLKLVDGTMAQLAIDIGLHTTDYDTMRAA
jgi:uncharacterized membrane protein YccC